MKEKEMTNELIKKWEQFSAKPYKDAVGVITIGYGTIKYPSWYLGGKKVEMTDPPITEDMASKFLQDYIDNEITPAMEYIKIPLNLNQKEAIKSFIYNLGPTNFKKSTLLKKTNAGDFDGAAPEFSEWITAGGKILKGLVRRRAEEMLIFLTPPYKNKTVEKPVEEKRNSNVIYSIINLLKGK